MHYDFRLQRSIPLITLVFVAVMFGALSQRITGMGFALVSSPFLVLLLGPFDGVLVVNICAIISAVLMLSRVWRDVAWNRYRRLLVPALCGILPGSWLATTLPAPTLAIAIGFLLVAGLVTSLLATRSDFTLAGAAPTVVAGFISGAMNTAAGIGGPAVSIYAVLTRWDQRSFAATLQPYFISITAFSLLTKLFFSHDAGPELGWWFWLGITIALICGLIIGEIISKHVSHEFARTAVILIAFTGAIITIVNGFLGL